MVSLSIKGRIMAPTCEFSCEDITFGVVSFAFTNTRLLRASVYFHLCRNITLINTSEVPMRFALRVPCESQAHNAEEFSIEPNSGTLKPLGTKEFTLSFTPKVVLLFPINLYYKGH